VRNQDLPFHELNPLDLTSRRGVQRDDLHQRLASLGNRERLALGSLFDEAGKMRLGLVHTYRAHRLLRMNQVMLVLSVDDRTATAFPTHEMSTPGSKATLNLYRPGKRSDHVIE
jgi:hypothetical protein